MVRESSHADQNPHPIPAAKTQSLSAFEDSERNTPIE
jgi:hypothetical protein